MEQSPSALQDARNLGVGELGASSPKTSSALKRVYQKVMYSFRKPRRKQSGMTCLPPIEEELQASVNALEEERRARVNEISVHHLVESTVDDVPAAPNTSSNGVGISTPTQAVRVDKCSPRTPSSTSLSSASAEYSSARIDRMVQTRSSFSTDLEFEIESSKDRWSEMAPLSDGSELVSQDPQAFFEQGIFAGEKCTERDLKYVRDVCNASLDHNTRDEHRDLKASNVLVEMIERSESEMEEIRNKEVDTFYCSVTDFESSKGVLGTGFWRAPEILVAGKNRCVTADLFTKASDVYSYAMTCYEMWTGCLPFENLKITEYDVVLGGERLVLPSGLKPWIHEMLKRCWHADPCQRPSFQDICDTIANNSQDASVKCMDDVEEKEFEKKMTFGPFYRPETFYRRETFYGGKFEDILKILEVSD